MPIFTKAEGHTTTATMNRLPSFAVFVSDPLLASQFTQGELRSYRAQYDAADVKRLNLLGPRELEAALAKQGVTLSPEEAERIVREKDSSRKGGVDFEAFLRVQLALQEGTLGLKTKAKLSPSFSRVFVKSQSTIYSHAIEDSEQTAYVNHINQSLKDDPVIGKRLPIDPKSSDLWEAVRDGILLCKLINVAVPGTIDERAINVKDKLNAWEKNENHELCINSAKAIGCSVVNVGPQDLVEARPHLVLGLISQIVKIQLLALVDVKKTPELAELLQQDEEYVDLAALPAEKLLLKWFNHHLKRVGYKSEVTNFSSDIKDSEAYTYLLHALAPECCDLSPLKLSEAMERAEAVLQNAGKLDARKYLQPKDIIAGQPNLNLAFVANLFSTRSGLSVDKAKVVQAAELLSDDENDSKEERAFRMWINSLGISTFVNQVFEDLRDGYVLAEVLDKVSPGCISWKRVSKPPIKMPFRKVENCNYAIDLGREWKFSLVGISGSDIVSGNKKFILAYLWQLMRHSMLLLLKKLRVQGKEVLDADILQWANEKVKASGKETQMGSFKDKTLANGLFFLDLLAAVEPRVVNWQLVTKGGTAEEKELNAKYIISVARKLGCSIFLLWDDIVEVRPKMMLTLTASIMLRAMSKGGVVNGGGNGAAAPSG